MASNALIVGEFGDREREELAQAVARASGTAVFCASVQKALLRLRGAQELPVCVVVHGDLNVRHLVDTIRDDAESFAVPVLAALPRLVPSSFREAYLAGADDVLMATDLHGLTRRLANLGVHRPERPAATLGRALIVSRDGASRRRLGRTLRQVGFDVAYASDLSEAVRSSSGEARPMFIVSTEVADPAVGSGSEPISSIDNVPVLFLNAVETDLPSKVGDQVTDITGRLLFFADEQAKAEFKDRRRSPRKLYSTICSFRDGGLVQPTFALTHNISREGMYIRSFDPPKAQTPVWIELCPPASEAAVHIRGRVIWQRLPGAGTGVVPPGFGIRLDRDHCPGPDLDDLVRGYQTLLP